MSLSIPPIFTIPNFGQLNPSLEVGNAIKDLPIGVETSMKKANDIANKHLEKEHALGLASYENKLGKAKIGAFEAEGKIGKAKLQKGIAITMLVVNIIGAVSITVIAAVTQMWPILFFAIPCLIAIIPSSYYTHTYRNEVSKLEEAIAAPGRMSKPHLSLQKYEPEKDFELAQSRQHKQESFIGMSIREIAEKEISTRNIIDYALLDRVTAVREENRPVFYAQCVQLIKAFKRISSEKEAYSRQVQKEFGRRSQELESWKTAKERRVKIEEEALQERENDTLRQVNGFQRHGAHVQVKNRSSNTVRLDRTPINRKRSNLYEKYGERKAEIRNWYNTEMQRVEGGFQQAVYNLEHQYLEAKKAASSEFLN
ncbi:hypothetical protein PHSC3_001609 [Chlamydiales bacterium STE3]|nr:hypothetical protein PHSC3_001609 [Chlamydiales bacterium STE3]